MYGWLVSGADKMQLILDSLKKREVFLSDG